MPRKTYTLCSLACAGVLAAVTAQAGEKVGMPDADSNSQVHEQMQQSGQSMESGMMHQTASPDLSRSYRSGQLIGMDVHNGENEKLGEISQLILDKSGRVTHVVLTRGGMLGVGGKGYVVPWDRIQIDSADQRATLDIPKARLSSEFSAFEPVVPQEQQQEQQQQQQEMNQ